MPHPRTRLVAAAVGAAALCVPLMSTGPADAATAGSSGRGTVPNTKPAWATQGRANGSVAASKSVSIRVGLQLRHAAAAQKLVQDVSNPASASYGHFLSAKTFNARYGPSQAQVKRVKSYLASQGIKVTSVADGNQWVSAKGSVSKLNKAFGTTLKTYSFHGKTLRAPSTAVTVPNKVHADISTVDGLAARPSYRRPMGQQVDPGKVGASRAAASNATPPPASKCSNYWGEFQQTVPKVDGKTKVNTYQCGLDPAQLRKIYGTTKAVAGGNDGKGITVAILDAYANPTMKADANRYSKAHGEPTFKGNQYTETKFSPFDLQAECGGEDGWNGEESLDVEAVHGMAPAAKIHYFGAKNCDTGLDDAMNFVIQNHSADIVSNSYGYVGEDVDPAVLALEHNLYVQAGAEGIGLYFSSGDNGDEVVNGLPPQPDYAASDPLVTAVGGTSELINKNGSTYRTTGWESALNDIDYSGARAKYVGPFPGEFYAGAGGGRSTLFAQPYYQKGTVPRALASNNGQLMRVSPDIAADGDPYTGFYYGYTPQGGTYAQSTIGGTSLATPLVAGIQALASQGRKFPIGFANPLIYSLKANAFHDVVPAGAPIRYASPSGSYVGTFEAGDTQKSRVGYDNITGRGTPNGKAFLNGERK